MVPTPDQPETPEVPAPPPALPIHTVHYQRLVSLGNYENERVGAWCAVEDGRTPEQTLSLLKTWVQTQVGEANEIARLEADIYRLRSEKDLLEQQVSTARSLYDRARAFVEGLGLKFPTRFTHDDDMPF